MNKARILLVDDEEEFLDALSKRLAMRDYWVITAGNGVEALKILEQDPDIEVVVLDLKMPGPDGIETLSMIKETYPLTEVIMLTGHATVESGVESLKLEAFDYIRKPCDIERLLQSVDQAAARKWKHESEVVGIRSNWSSGREQALEKASTPVKKLFAAKIQ